MSAWCGTQAVDPWLLISDQGAGYRQVQVCASRMRVEATFQDGKSRGFNIEASWIVERAHLDRLLLALFWPCGGSRLAAACVHHGQRQRFDRLEPRQKHLSARTALALRYLRRSTIEPP